MNIGTFFNKPEPEGEDKVEEEDESENSIDEYLDKESEYGTFESEKEPSTNNANRGNGSYLDKVMSKDQQKNFETKRLSVSKYGIKQVSQIK